MESVTWEQAFHRKTGAIISSSQALLTFVILGIEFGNQVIEISRMNAFVGFWTCPFFMGAWISLAAASCCCIIRCCGITTLVFQFLSASAAIALIGLDSYFLRHPTQCFFSDYCSVDRNSTSFYSYKPDDTATYQIKVPLIAGHLCAGILMLILCVIYIIIFFKVNRKVKTPDKKYVPAPYMERLEDRPYPSTLNTNIMTIKCPDCNRKWELHFDPI